MPVSQVVRGPAGPLAVWDWPGGAPPILLLHGIGNYGRVWDQVAEAVGGRLRLVAPDARGHGDSARPTAGYAPEDFVADALAILDALGIHRTVAVGHSMGGGHALALAALHPERVSALALVDMGPEIGREGGERARRLSLTRPARFADAAAAEAYLRETSPGYPDRVYADRITHAFRHDEHGLVWRSDPAALGHILTGPDRSAYAWQALAGLRLPVLVVRGTRSETLRAETYRRMLDLLSDGSGLELDAGHNVQLDQPAALAEAIVALARRS